MRINHFLSFGILIFSACNSGVSKNDPLYSLPAGYSLENRTTISLNNSLREISGIFWREDMIWAIDDEFGDLFLLDPQTGEIKNRVKFGKDQDYEDLVIAGDTVWVLRSNGDMYRVTDFWKENPRTEIFEFGRKGKKDFEALVKMPDENALLLLCKSCEWDKKKEASVFRFDISLGTFSENPLETLRMDEIERTIEAGIPGKNSAMEPSAVAFHPISGDLYILSSVGKWLMVTSSSFSPKSFHQLDPEYFVQPEGITFDPEGNLYISNEGQNTSPNLIKFPFSR